MGQNSSLLRILVCAVFISLQFSNQILFHGNWGFRNFSMVSAVLFLIIKVLCFHHYFHFPCLFLCHFIYLVSFVVLSFYLTIWFLQGWFLLRVRGNVRSSNWYFIFPSLHVLYILSSFYFKLFFSVFLWHVWNICTFFAQLHINDHLFVPLYCILLF